ncbi:hypothetical protein UlMin_022222 [Ulmus minor]
MSLSSMATTLLHQKHVLLLVHLSPLLFFIHGNAQPLLNDPFFSQFNPENGVPSEAKDFFSNPFLGFSDREPPPPSENNNNNNNNNNGQELPKNGAAPADNSQNPQRDAKAMADYETNYKGTWVLIAKDSGVSGMHSILLPNNKIIMYDASAFHISALKLPNNVCVPFMDKKTKKQLQDCWAHGVEFDIPTGQVRPLKMEYDMWCSSGGLMVDGTLLGTGGWDNGIKAVRYLKPCGGLGCDFLEYQTTLADPRWYATQITLADGRYIVVGGRRAYSFEYVPPPGTSNQKPTFLSLLDETTDMDENNLYPFVYQSTDGNVFIFANNRSVLLNPKTDEVVLEFPVLDGGSRNYPASGMSALLPIRLDLLNDINDTPPAEVIVCGGAKHEAYALAGRGTFIPALDDCNRLVITDPNPVWKRETMPSRRVMGDMIILPTGDLLLVSGAKLGTAAWFFAEDPNLIPALYSPEKPVNQRFVELQGTDIPRMYHSSAALLPDGRVLIAGSNTNIGYNFTAKYPTELRVQTFSPPYLDPQLANKRPVIVPEAATAKLLGYGMKFEIFITLPGPRLQKEDVKVTMYPPAFTTHGYSMNQRLVVLKTEEVNRLAKGKHKIETVAPPSTAVAPPGFYLLFVVHRGLPSDAIWVQMNK